MRCRYAVAIGFVLCLVPQGLEAQTDAPGPGGVHLGMSPAAVRRVLGRPERLQGSLGFKFWDYRQRGLTVIWDEATSAVHGVVLSKRAAGDIQGVRVGDSAAALRARMGPATRIRTDGRFYDFAHRVWTVSFEIANGQIVEITLLAVE